MRKKTTVGQVSRYNLKLTIKARDWRVGGLVGSCVGGLVSGMAERNWYWAHSGFFFRQNQLLFFYIGMEKSDLDDIGQHQQ